MPSRLRVAGGIAATVALACVGPACWLTSSFDALVDAGAPTASDAGADATSDARLEGGSVDAPVDVPNDAVGEAPAPQDAGCLTTDYVSSVMADQPLAYWRLDEDAGTIATDSTGGHYDGTYSNGVTLGVPGILAGDTAASFDGDGGYVDIGAHLAFLQEAAFSIEAWIRPSRIDGAFRGVVSNESPSISQRFGYLLYIERPADGGVVSGFERWNGGMSNPTVHMGDVAQGAWTHVVGTFDGTNEEYFVNGSPVSADNGPIKITTTGSFVIGALNSAATPTFFAGTIDEVAVYNHALAPRCVEAHYNLALGRSP